jgi:hypothetical protein
MRQLGRVRMNQTFMVMGPALKSLLCESGTLTKFSLNNNTREIFLWQIFRIVKIVRPPNQIFYPFYNLLEHQLK